MSCARPFLHRCLLSGLLFTSAVVYFDSPVDATHPQTITDDLQCSVTFLHVPTRAMSLAPSITEMLFANGLDREILGGALFCSSPSQASCNPKVGYSNLSCEALNLRLPHMMLAPGECRHADPLNPFNQPLITDGVRSNSRTDLPCLNESGNQLVSRNTDRPNDWCQSLEQAGPVPSPPVMPLGYRVISTKRDHAEYKSGTEKMVQIHHGAATVSGE